MSQQTPPPGQPRFIGTGGRDPRQPFGAAAAQSSADDQRAGQRPVDPADRFRARRRIAPLLVSLAVMAATLLGVWAAGKYLPDPTATSSASPSPTPTAPSTPTPLPSSAATGLHSQVPFTNSFDNSAGTFEITSHQWTSQGLVLNVKVHLDQGQQRLLFFCLDNATTKDFDPDRNVPNQLDGQSVSAGQTVTGTVVFDKPKGDTTVFLAGSDGKQVAALMVTG